MGFLKHQQYFIIFLVQLQAMNEDRSDFQRRLQSDPSVACEELKTSGRSLCLIRCARVKKTPYIGGYRHPSFIRESL